MANGRALLLVALGVGAAACHPPPLPSLADPGPLRAEDHAQVLASWTRSAKLYQGFENKLFISATYHSAALRRAFAVAFPDIYGHGGTITRRELVDLTGGVQAYHNLFVAMYTPDRRWNDLETPDSIWRLTLTDSTGATVALAEVESVRIDANLRAVYQHLDNFDKAYLVRFPRVDLLGRAILSERCQWFTLRIASALGAAELRWDVAASAAGAAEPAPSNQPAGATSGP